MTGERILVVDDESDIRQLVQEILSEEGYEVEVAANGAEARTARNAQRPQLVLLDIWMPDVDGITLLREWSGDPADACPVVMMSGHGSVETAVEATRLGAIDFVEKPLSLAKLLHTVRRALESRPAAPLRGGGARAFAPGGRSRIAQELREELGRHAVRREPLLLLAESGSEAETLARYVHLSGPHAVGPFVVLNSRALSEEQLLAALGNSGEASLVAQARGGTLYLGDIEELPEAARRRLAGLLSENPDERFIATAQPGFEARVGDNAVVRDLLAMLSVLPLRVPPLREYAEDVPELLRQCVDQLTDSEGLRFRRFSVAAQNRLRHYPWPGNQRELRNLVRRLLLRTGGEEVTLEEVERELSTNVPGNVPLVQVDLLSMPLREAREHFERNYLLQQLQLCGGKVGQLAKRVGMERTHLYRKLRSLGIDLKHVSEE